MTNTSVPTWRWSAELGLYRYHPHTDTIEPQNGKPYPRPSHILKSSLVKLGGASEQAPSTGKPYPRPSHILKSSLVKLGGASEQAPSTYMHPPTLPRPTLAKVSFPTTERGSRHETPSHHQLMESFKLRKSGFFKVGRAFMMLWSEPAGNTSNVSAMWEDELIKELPKKVFTKIRRFVVVREGGSYCSALPINTYGGRGVAKPGADKSEHGIIYTGRMPPSPLVKELPTEKEAGMIPLAIRLDPDSATDRLESTSRIDYGGITRVQHNIKVKSIGVVNESFVDVFRSQFDTVFRRLPKPVSAADEYDD